MFRAQEVVWLGDPAAARARLEEDELAILGYISDASNGAILCVVGNPEDRVFGVYKPEGMERPLWDFPDGSLYLREVAAHLVSDFLGWGLVPPTVTREGPAGPGSIQLFVPHDPAEHYFTFVEQPRWAGPLAQMAMFDMVINNADRKGGHILRNLAQDRLLGIDNGLSFHPEPKLRTVVWDIDDVPFASAWQTDLRRLADALGDPDSPLRAGLSGLLTPDELDVLRRRALQVADMDAVPHVHPDRRHYPWPPI